MDEPTDFSYIDLLRERLVIGMLQAQKALQPAELWVGKTEAPGWAFNRRPIYKTSMGEQVGTQGSLLDENFLGMEAPNENELKALIARDLNGKVLGGMVNFTCHPTVMGAEPVYSADFCGELTETLAKRHGGIFAFAQGAAGNQWCIDMANYDPNMKPVYVNEDTPKTDIPFREMGPKHAKEMGVALADKFDEAIANSRKLPGKRVYSKSAILRIPQRRPTFEQVQLAKWYLEERKGDIDENEFTRKHYGHPYTFYSNDSIVQDWIMRETIGMWEWQKRCGLREIIEDVEVHTLAIDDLAFAGFAAEYFSEYGFRLKARSPFSDTFVIELANGWHGYVPTPEGHAHGGYEARLGYQSRLIEDAGDRMLSAALMLLEELSRRQALG